MVTIAKREFRGILLSNIIEFINKKVKQYSLSVFGTTELNFTLNENCIDITYHNKMYENLSGGEKQKIDIIIQLALRDILSKQLNIHTNLLICDEIYDNMDSISCQKITNIISTLTQSSQQPDLSTPDVESVGQKGPVACSVLPSGVRGRAGSQCPQPSS